MDNIVFFDLNATNKIFYVDIKVGPSCLGGHLTVPHAQVEVRMTEGNITPVLLSFVGGTFKPSVIE